MALLPEGLAEIRRLDSNSRWGPYFAAPYVRGSDAWAVLGWLVLVCTLRLACCGMPATRQIKASSRCPLRRLAQAFVSPRNVHKLVECFWYLIWHTLSAALCLYCFFVAEWNVDGVPGTANWAQLFFKSKDYGWYLLSTPDDRMLTGATGWPNLHPSEFMRQTYLLQLAFWISCLLFVAFETKHSDLYVLVVHHVATIMLVALSWKLAFYRLGLVVLLLHDPVDVFLYLAKTLYYVNKTQEYVTVAFTGLLGSYAILRLLAFPILCVYPAWTMDKGGKLFGKGYSMQPTIPGGIVLPSFLVLLQVMHCYWFHLLIGLAVDKAKGGTIKDTRAIDSEEETSAPTTECTKRSSPTSDGLLCERKG